MSVLRRIIQESLSKYLSIPRIFLSRMISSRLQPLYNVARAISASRSLVPHDFDDIFRCVWPIVDDHSRLFDASTLLDNTMDPFSLRSSTRNRPFRAPEPQKCLHLPELGCVCSRWKLLGLFGVSTRNASIYRTVYNTRPSGQGPVPGYFIFVHPGTTNTMKKNRSNKRKARYLTVSREPILKFESGIGFLKFSVL